MTKSSITQPVGFITRNHDGRKQWLSRICYRPFEMDWSDKPANYMMYDQASFEELQRVAPHTSIRMNDLAFRPCTVKMRGQRVYASDTDVTAAINE